MAQHNEKPFEDELCAHLASHGWLYSPNDDEYDRARALFPEDLFGWLEDTQPVTYGSIVKPSMSEKEVRSAQAKILDRVVKVLDTPLTADGGTLNLLRGGFKVGTSKRLDMSYPRPATSLNPKAAVLYGKTRVRVMRQVHFATSGNHTLDLVDTRNSTPEFPLFPHVPGVVVCTVGMHECRPPESAGTCLAPLSEPGVLVQS